MKILITLSLLLLSHISYAKVTKEEATIIYRNIVNANGMMVYPKLTFSKSREVNAYQGGWRITINKGMLDIANKDEMAWVIGHELGHFKLWHIRSTPSNEYAADSIGWKYASKTGYNMCKAKELLKKFPQVYSKTHPHPKDRYKHLPRC